MNNKRIAVSIKEQNNPSGIFFYLIIFLLISAFAFIIEKNVSMSQAIILPVGVIGLFVMFCYAFSKPEMPFLILVLYFPFAKILVGDFGTNATALNLTNIVMLIAIIGWLVKSSKERSRFFEKTSLNLPITLFILWGLFSLVKSSYAYGAIYFEDAIPQLKRWLTPIILYFITLGVIKDRSSFKKVVSVMMLVIVIVGLMAVKDYIDIGSASSIERSRVGGVFEQPNTLAGFFVYNMFLFLGFFFVYFPNLRYLLLLIPFLICFRGIQVTFSRGAYVACAFGGVAISYFKNKALFVAAIALLIFALLNPSILPPGIRDRLSSTFSDRSKVISTNIEDIKDKSAQTRIIIWEGAIEMIKDYPIFGVGYGLFPHFIGSYAVIKNIDAHNTYLIVAAEMGMPALLVFLLILFIMIKNSRWLYKNCKDKFVKAFALGMLGGLFGLLMVNMFGSRLNSEEVSAYFWIYAGLIMVAVRMKQKGIIV